MFAKVLIANRGEIAQRLIRGCRELGIDTVAVYSEADQHSPHVCAADQAFCIGAPPAEQSYLCADKLIDVARRSGATAIHPGYGFLSENAAFAAACVDAGLSFIGPTAETIEALGDKARARQLAIEAGVPVLPGGPAATAADAAALAERIGYPILLKAAAGGGGKGMRIVHQAASMDDAFVAAEREACAAFGKGALLVERFVERPRHVEVQILADGNGQTVHLGERECSIQRRHQKIIEESPSPAVDNALRQRLGRAAVSLAQEAGYVNAGTVEFLLAPDGEFYFLEVNTRLQVEHPVTELVTNLDLVHLQLKIAANEPLPRLEDMRQPKGHAIECRIYAEDPSRDFAPSPGQIAVLAEPHTPGLRIDSGVVQGQTIPLHYDPIVAKMIAWGATRAAATARLRHGLANYVLLGCRHNVDFLGDVLAHREFVAGNLHTGFVAEHMSPYQPVAPQDDAWSVAAALDSGFMDRPSPNTARGSVAAGGGPWASLASWRLR